MPYPDQTLESREKAVLFALILSAACAIPATAAAHDGTWAQLGVPFRFEAPLLWDSAERRFVGIGAAALGAADTIEDAWEFREPAGWRRIRLPQPPAGLELGLWGPFPDPARRRYVHLAFTDASLDSLRLWALELVPEPHWACLDVSSSVPMGRPVQDLAGEALWFQSLYSYPNDPELWSRSFADTGTWRCVRPVPRWPTGSADFVDAKHDRRVVVRLDPDTAMVWLLPLSGDEDWTLATTGSPSPPKAYPRMVVPDAARERLLFYIPDVTQPGFHEVWALDLDGAPRWELLGSAGYPVGRLVTGTACDTLVLHGQSELPGWAGARTIAVTLSEPTRARVLFDPAWPPPLQGAALVPDAPRGRWLLVGGRPWSGLAYHSFEVPDGSLDSLWELTLYRDNVTWRRHAVAGAGPVLGGGRAWTVDEAEGTLYVLNGWNASTGSPTGPRELWALRPEWPPRWELLLSGGLDDWPRLGMPVFVFDSIRRRLVCFGYRASESSLPANEVWEYDVDGPAGWTLAVPMGVPPEFQVSSTAAFDAAASRVVMLGVNAQIATLSTTPELRWDTAHCPDPMGGTCLPARYGTQGVFDVVGRRLLELGGYDPFWLHLGVGHDLYGLSVDDSLGPSRRLEVLGSPGWQDIPTIGLDVARDGLLVFGNWSNGAPSLQEFNFDRAGRAVARPRAWAALADRNVLRWAATAGATFQLWRLAPGEGWAVLGSISAPASGELSFDDRAIESGTRYGYRLTVSPSALEPVAADVWLTAATTPSFSLARPWPNPARGALNLSFTLAAPAPADLDVFDIAGRRVWSRRWGQPAPGPHHVAIAAAELPRSGLYFVRLRQAGLTATRRVVLAP